MGYIVITLVVVSFIFEYWLLSKINKLNKENKIHRKSLQVALEALARDTHNFQAGISRDLEHTNKIMDSNFTRLKRIDKKVDVNKRDIMNSLPTQIRKTIGHIEFAQPLDKK
jgi:biopolymer transport protein ExbB/TolQ